jgi:hypothetical protein
MRETLTRRPHPLSPQHIRVERVIALALDIRQNVARPFVGHLADCFFGSVHRRLKSLPILQYIIFRWRGRREMRMDRSRSPCTALNPPFDR